MKELFASLQKSNEEKLKSPIFISFIISLSASLLIIYWRPISIFFLSPDRIETRIETINKQIQLITTGQLIWALFISALLSVLYTLGIPFIQKFINNLLHPLQKNALDNSSELELYKITGKINLEFAEKALREQKNKNIEERNYEFQIESLQEKINDLLIKNAKLIEENNNQNKHINEIHKREIAQIKGNYEQQIELLSQDIELLNQEVDMLQASLESRNIADYQEKERLERIQYEEFQEYNRNILALEEKNALLQDKINVLQNELDSKNKI